MPQTDWFDHGLRFLSILVPVGIAVFQINRNYQSTLKAQREQYKKQLSLDIYRQLSEGIVTALSKLDNLRVISEAAVYWMRRRAEELPLPPQAYDNHDMTAARKDVDSTLMAMTISMYRYEIALKDLKPILEEIKSKRQTWWINAVNFHAMAEEYIPPKHQDGQPANRGWPQPSHEKLDDILITHEHHIRHIGELHDLLHDLMERAQHVLVGSIFQSS